MNKQQLAELQDFDREHIWHPYSSMLHPLPVYLVESASGVRLRLCDGRELLDGMASWWSAIHGYNHPQLNLAIKNQVDRMCHVMFGGLTHEPAVELVKQLVAITPPQLDKVFLADSGSVAVEVAMKMAIQYHYAIGHPERNRFLTIRGGYHGDTFHCMAVCDPINGMHHIFSSTLPQYHFADRPGCGFYADWDESDITGFADQMQKLHPSLAAVILEPIVQGAGGMWFYHPEYLRQVRKICDQYGVLLICDEIATGFGRTGKMFACEHSNIVPDILCLGKALTGGTMTLAAVLASNKVSSGISEGEPGVFMHGPTFMGNPLACSAAAASIKLLLDSDWQGRVFTLEQQLMQGLAPCQEMDHVLDVRVLGAIGVVELKQPVNMQRCQQNFVDRGVWVRPFGRLVYVMPPYCMEKEDIDLLTRIIVEVVALEAGL